MLAGYCGLSLLLQSQLTGVKTGASHKGGNRKIRENTIHILNLTKHIGFSDFSPYYGSWENLDMIKRMSEDVRTVSDIENAIRYFMFLIIFDTLPPLLAEASGRAEPEQVEHL